MAYQNVGRGIETTNILLARGREEKWDFVFVAEAWEGRKGERTSQQGYRLFSKPGSPLSLYIREEVHLTALGSTIEVNDKWIVAGDIITGVYISPKTRIGDLRELLLTTPNRQPARGLQLHTTSQKSPARRSHKTQPARKAYKGLHMEEVAYSAIEARIQHALENRENNRLDTYIAWVKGHKDIKGNEKADKLSKETSILGHESEAVVTPAGLRAWARRERAKARGGSEGILGWHRKAISAYTWCVTEKGPQNKWLHKIKKSDTPACRCQQERPTQHQEEQSGEHLAERCRLLSRARTQVERKELLEWRSRHARNKIEEKKKKGPVEPGKEEEEDKLETFFCDSIFRSPMRRSLFRRNCRHVTQSISFPLFPLLMRLLLPLLPFPLLMRLLLSLLPLLMRLIILWFPRHISLLLLPLLLRLPLLMRLIILWFPRPISLFLLPFHLRFRPPIILLSLPLTLLLLHLLLFRPLLLVLSQTHSYVL